MLPFRVLSFCEGNASLTNTGPVANPTPMAETMLEAILRALCRDEGDVAADLERWSTLSTDVTDPLRLLRSSFPDLAQFVRGRRVLDFGCGHGAQVVEFARLGAARAVGLDINEQYLELARERAAAFEYSTVSFHAELPAEWVGTFDVVFSQNSMEHFEDPAGVLSYMYEVLRPGGRLGVTFSPPWLNAYGSHMRFITPLPWVHLLFPEEVVMRVRSRYVSDNAKRYEEVEGGLNRMTLNKFERIVSESSFSMERLHFWPVKELPLVTRIPLLREFTTSRVDCLLRK